MLPSSRLPHLACCWSWPNPPSPAARPWSRPIIRRRYPVAALDYVRAHPDAVHGEMFNYFLWGGYIEFALPQRKPFIDSRNYSYGIDLFHEFQTANEPKPGWEAVFAKYNVGWTILPVQHPLNQVLALNPHWALVYSNQLTLIFSRVS